MLVSSAVVLGLVALQPPGPGSAAAESPARPHIVIIYADDLGYGDLGVYGHNVVQTPNLDRLAEQGLRLTDYYAPSPLCSPSRAALLTGRTPFRTGIESWIPQDQDVQLGPGEVTLATLLRGVGYDTFLGGKWHLNGGLDVADHTQPDDHGFEHWLALHAFPVPHNRNPTNFYRNGVPLGEVEGYTADIVVDEAIGWLGDWVDEAGSDPEAERRFFMYLAMIEPHSTIANPEELNDMYSAFTRGEPDPFVNGLPEPPDNLEARGPGEYWANITYMDAQLGRFLDTLDELGLAGDTLVFFASDNGPVTTAWRHWWEVNLYGSTGGLRGRKADLYEGGIREPAMIRWPGVIEAGRVSDAVLQGYDLLPTLASVAGYEVPADRPIDGEDFSAVLFDEPWQRRRPVYWEFADDQGFHFALRDGRWKLLADESLERVELYDLQQDRFELLDRADDRPEVVARLLRQLRAIDRSVEEDPLRLRPPGP